MIQHDGSSTAAPYGRFSLLHPNNAPPDQTLGNCKRPTVRKSPATASPTVKYASPTEPSTSPSSSPTSDNPYSGLTSSTDSTSPPITGTNVSSTSMTGHSSPWATPAIPNRIESQTSTSSIKKRTLSTNSSTVTRHFQRRHSRQKTYHTASNTTSRLTATPFNPGHANSIPKN